MQEDLEYISVVKRQNKALRKIHKILRGALKSSKEHSDELFTELCEIDNSAQLEMEKLWTLGELEHICGPQDYEIIADFYLEQLGKKSPIDQKQQCK